MALAQVHGAVIAGMTGTVVTVKESVQPRYRHVREAIERHWPLLDEVP